jgi:hypothetical protein
MSTNTTSTAISAPRLPYTLNEGALSQYLSDTPKAHALKHLSKFEKAYLVSLGIEPSENVGIQRFPVLGTASAKTRKGEAMAYLTGICYLSPASESGFLNICFWAKNCRALCLNTSGRGAFSSVQKARRIKTARLAFYGVQTFLLNAVLDVRKIAKQAERKGFKVAIRLDGTSDLGLVNHPIQSLGNQTIAQLFPAVEFYEYTKSFQRMASFLKVEMPNNVHFTFSLDGETNRKSAEILLAKGGNVAACFQGSPPETFMGVRVLDGDKSDLRFLDAISHLSTGYIVGLKAKGKAKTLRNGFVQTV